MSRHSSQDSWTDATSSVYSDERERDRRDRDQDRTRVHSRTRYQYVKPSIKSYDSRGHHDIREFAHADDYPHDPSRRARDYYPDGLGLGGRRPNLARASTLPQMPDLYDAGGIDPRMGRQAALGGGMQSRNYAYPQSQGLMPDNLYGDQSQNYMAGNLANTQDRATMEELTFLLKQLNSNRQRMPAGQESYTMDELRVMLDQLNNEKHRTPQGQDRQTMDELRTLLHQLNLQKQHAPLGRDRTDATLYNHVDPMRMPALGRRQSERMGRGYLDDDETDPRYASRGTAYDSYQRY